MKKSELKNIIRESIKKLINEQATGLRCGVTPAHAFPGNTWGGQGQFDNMTIDGATPTVGQIFEFNGTFGSYTNLTIPGTPSWLANACPTYGAMSYWDYPLSQGTPGNNWRVVSTMPVIGNPPLIDYTSTSDNPCTWAQFANQFLNGNHPQCDIGCGTAVYGCTDPNALNYDPNANMSHSGTPCDYGFRCKQKGNHPKFGSECAPGNQNNPGSFTTLQDCLNSGCEKRIEPDIDKTIKEPAGPSITPFTIDPQDMVKPEEDRVKRMQELANIKK